MWRAEGKEIPELGAMTALNGHLGTYTFRPGEKNALRLGKARTRNMKDEGQVAVGQEAGGQEAESKGDGG